MRFAKLRCRSLIRIKMVGMTRILILQRRQGRRRLLRSQVLSLMLLLGDCVTAQITAGARVAHKRVASMLSGPISSETILTRRFVMRLLRTLITSSLSLTIMVRKMLITPLTYLF